MWVELTANGQTYSGKGDISWSLTTGQVAITLSAGAAPSSDAGNVIITPKINDGNSTTQLWDGTSFQGSSKWSVRPAT